MFLGKSLFKDFRLHELSFLILLSKDSGTDPQLPKSGISVVILENYKIVYGSLIGNIFENCLVITCSLISFLKATGI